RLRAQGLAALAPDEALDGLERALAAGEPVVAVLPLAGRPPADHAGPPAFGVLVERAEHLHAQRDAARANVASGVTPDLRAALDAASAAERPRLLAAHVEGLVRHVLGLGEDDPIEHDRPLIELGLDSLMVIELRNAIADSVGRTLPVEALSAELSLGGLLELLAAEDGTPTAAPEPQPQADGVSRADATPSRALLEQRMEPMETLLGGMRERGAYFFEEPVSELDGPWVRCANGGRKLMFSTYSYLGLLGHPAIEAAAREAVERYGTGTHGVRIAGGTLDLHKRLEARIAEYTGREAAIVFSSGFMTNYASISTLVSQGDWVIGDQLNHASILDGCKASEATFRVYRHGDLEDLESILRQAPSGVVKLVVTDGVFSLDGDVVDLPAVLALCRRYGALLMVDEAHSLGVLGEHGRGVEDLYDLPGSVDVYMGTLSKTIPAVGGFIAGDRRLVEFLRFGARGYGFSAATPPPVAAAALAAFDVLDSEGAERRRLLHARVAQFADGLRRAGFDTGQSTTAILPVMLGDEQLAIEMARRCQAGGLFCLPAVAPAVPIGTARLRLNVTSSHTEEDVQHALGIIIRAGHELLPDRIRLLEDAP
ncbi:MAG: aminotransferase class I/II-fold pyridoxal phosphate-dependent enzyme, partial [Planctomycetota bacterium]